MGHRSYETLIRANQINLIPFASEGMTTYVLNILLFIPLGYLLPTIWPQFRTIKIPPMLDSVFHWLLS